MFVLSIWVIASILTSITDWIGQFSSQPVFYGVIALVAGLDSVIPLVPGETTVILGGISAGRHHLALAGVIAAGAVGALIGDSTAYAVGRYAGAWTVDRLVRGEKGQQRLEWAKRQLAARGGVLLLTARFIPGGRTVVTLASGLTRQPYGRFLVFDAIACGLWASYAAGLGFYFGERFSENHTLAFLLAMVTAVAVSVIIEGARWGWHRRNAAAD